MKVKRFSKAIRYDASNHRSFKGLRLQAFEPDGPKNQWVGISHFSPAAAPPQRRRTPRSLAVRESLCLLGRQCDRHYQRRRVRPQSDGFLHSCAQRSARDRQSPEQCRDDFGRNTIPARVRTRLRDCTGQERTEWSVLRWSTLAGGRARWAP
jgi:hypothetical protein